MEFAALHPQMAHFVIALLIVGVLFRLVSLTGRVPFAGPAASTLILLGTLAAVMAVQSGMDAHGIPERIPGARNAVVEHEEWGERSRNLFLIVALLEIGVIALAAGGRRGMARGVTFASALLGLMGLYFVYQTGEHGGKIVYSHAGGVGTRSGDPKDVENLLVAGLYHNAARHREAGDKQEAARLYQELARLRPEDPSVRLLEIESVLKDRGDAAVAMMLLDGFDPGQDARSAARAGLLRVDALEAAGQPDSAAALLERLKREYPQSRMVQQRESVGGGG